MDMTEDQATLIIELLTGIQKDLHTIASGTEVKEVTTNIHVDMNDDALQAKVQKVLREEYKALAATFPQGLL